MSFLIARADKHMWEEPVVSGIKGSGTIFFGGCVLRCIYCQNHEISHNAGGLRISENQLIGLMLSLQDDGAHNINLVTPSHYATALARLLSKVKSRLTIPVVYNSSGYDRLTDLQKLDGLVDVYLPDLKYVDSNISYNYSGKADYFDIASRAIKEMRRQQPCDCFINYQADLQNRLGKDNQIINYKCQTNRLYPISKNGEYATNDSLNVIGKGSENITISQSNAIDNGESKKAVLKQNPCCRLIKRGVIVRHLVLPYQTEDSIRVLDFLASLDKRLYVSLMAQYFPTSATLFHPHLNRRLTPDEYNAVKNHFFKAGLQHGFLQDLTSAIQDYVPSFDLDSLKARLKLAEKYLNQ